MRSTAEIVRERVPFLTGSEVVAAALAELLEAGGKALRDHPLCGPCEYGSCRSPSTADSPFCRKHSVKS